jgi:hypothetical protein
MQRLTGMHLYSPLVTIYQRGCQVVLSLSNVVFKYRTYCCLDRADSEFPPSADIRTSEAHCRRIGSASFGANPLEWVRAAVSPGLRQQRSSREIDAAKRTKDGDESQNIFDTVVSEEEKTQQKDSTPSAGASRQSDHVREYTAFFLDREHHLLNYGSRTHSTSTLRRISKSHTGNSTNSVVNFPESP